MEFKKELILDDESVAILEDFTDLIERIAEITGLSVLPVMSYFSDCCLSGGELAVHNLKDIENYCHKGE